MKKWLYKWLPIICGCHCKKERSFHYKGEQFPICARCTGELVGIIFSLISCFFYQLPVWGSVVVMIPMIIDGFVQALTAYESNNRRRFVTGFLFGFGLFMILAVITIKSFLFGVDLSRQLM